MAHFRKILLQMIKCGQDAISRLQSPPIVVAENRGKKVLGSANGKALVL